MSEKAPSVRELLAAETVREPNERQKRFFHNVARGMPPTSAYRDAYPEGNPKSAGAGAKRLTTNPHFVEWFKRYMTKEGLNHSVSMEEVILNLRKVIDQSMDAGKYGDTNKALELLARFSLFRDEERTDPFHAKISFERAVLVAGEKEKKDDKPT